ncbi:zinc finger protein 638 [Mantella aurantiaca]
MQPNNEVNSSAECTVHCNGVTPQQGNHGGQGNPGGQGAPDPRNSFVLFLENCAPVVNTLNFGISSPILLSHPHLQLAHLKTQLALQQLTSVTSNSTPPIYALLNQALLKIGTAQAMFNSRGGFPGQRPMGPPRMNQPGLNHLGMNMPGMNMSGMNMSGMGMSNMSQPNMNLPSMSQTNMNLSSMNQPNMNLSGMNQPSMNAPMNTGMTRMGHPGMNPNVGLANVSQTPMNQPPMNQTGMNVFRMGPPGMNQGGMGFQPEVKSQGFGMRQMDSPGSFLGGNSDSMQMKSMPLRTPERNMGPQALPQRFSSSSSPMTPAQPRMLLQNQEIPSIVNRVLTHSSDHLRGNPKTSLQEPPHLMEKKPLNPINMFGNVNQDMGIKSGPSSSLINMSNTQNRYTNESASSILESFGLSNQDLEELSRYPDDKLTPENLPNILRDIRMRKITRSGGTHDQGGGGGGRRPGSEVLPSKVIDYGHSSKFQFNDNPTPSRSFDSSRKDQKPSSGSKDPAPSSVNKGGKDKNPMDNKIPTISSSRMSTRQASKPGRSNNKTLVGEQETVKSSDSSVTVLKAKSPVITIQPDSTALRDVPVITDTAVTTSSSDMTAESPIGTVVSQVNYPQPADATPTGKGNRVGNQEDAQKIKRMPTPSMKNDYFAASPRIFPHICSLCNVECRHLKDWIKHQNNTSHIESCRKLRQQYPDWNPQVHTLRNEDKRDEATPKRSRSKSGSPRRARRSGSRSRSRRSRSRSPRSGRRSRSRSPRRARHSPRKSRSPRKGTRSPRRSPSPRRHRRGRSTTPPDKRAVDAAVQSFIEASKIKSGEKARPAKPSSDVKKLPPKPANSNVKGKKPAGGSAPTKNTGSTVKKTSSASSYSSSSKKPGSSSSVRSGSSGSSSAPRKLVSSNTSKKPMPISSAPKKPIVSTGAKKTATSNVSIKKPQPNRMSNIQKGPKQPAPEPYNPLNKFTSKSGSDKIIHVTNLPDSGYTDQDILKIVQQFGKVCDILILRSKNEAFLETNFKEAAAAAVKFSETVPVMINGNRVILSLAGRYKGPVKKEIKVTSGAESEKSAAQKAQQEEKTRKEERAHKEENEKKKSAASKHDIEVPPGFVKCYRLADPPLKDADKCIVVVSNLPEKQYTVEEISNLARPFGGVNDILIVANYRKAFLELPSKNSVDSMLKFYNVFPTCLSGNILNIAMAPGYKDLKDENRIFAEVIEQTSFKIIPTIYEKFVHLTNLPEREIEEFELTRIGLRFGKVEHYIVISNKRKAILHMSSPSVAKSMHTFLSRFPGRIGESVLNCSLVGKPKLSEDEYITYLEEKQSSKPDNKMPEEVPPTPDEVSQPMEVEVEEPPPPLSDTQVAETEVKAAVVFSNVEVEDDEDDEEAAEAPEAPEGSEAPSFFFQPEPVVEKPVHYEVAPVYVTEESDVLVSVESDEEECDAQGHDILNAIPVIDSISMEHLLAAEDSEESDAIDMETSANEMSGDCPKPVDIPSVIPDQIPVALEVKPEEPVKEEVNVVESQAPDTATEPTDKESAVINPPDKEEASATRTEESSDDKETKSESSRSPKDKKIKRNEETAQSHEDKPRQRREKSRQSSHGKSVDGSTGEANEESKEAEQATPTSKASVTRTAKYNPQRGELSVTLTVDSQKSSSRTADSRKKVPGDRGSSGRESSTPKSSSNRSSPAESASSNPKTNTGLYQTKSSHRGVPAQDRDTKSSSRSRENDSRTNRKDDRSKDGNSSSRHTRSSNRSTRGQRPKEQESELWVNLPLSLFGRSPLLKMEGDTFPFNLDEFVTVDEIVEENTDSQKQEEEEEEEGRKSPVIGATKRGEKRKEIHPPATDSKKPKEAGAEAQELSFVTLDEVGDEEENTIPPESSQDEAAPPLDEIHAEDKVLAADAPPASAQQTGVLMALDEVSDDDEPNVSVVPSGSSAIPDKDQLLTLDEISGEDEEQTSNCEPFNPDIFLTQVHKSNEGSGSAKPETQEDPDVRPQEPDQEMAQPLLTLDEVKADDDDEDYSLGDMEHHFLTVDEVGEEEEDAEVKEEDVVKPKPNAAASKPVQTKSKSSPKVSQQAPKTPARRGRPRKRPLSESADDTKDTPQQASAASNASEPAKTPSKPKAKATTKDTDDQTITTPDKPLTGTPKTSETPAKKTKLETPPSEKKILSPFNSSVPVGLEFLVPKTGHFCELCSLFYMDDASKLKHCKSLRHYQAVQKHMEKEEETKAEKSSST